MTALAERALLGAQRPRVCAVPESASSAGREAVELAAAAGLHLDPWQRFVLEQALGERRDGRWSAFEVGLIVSRQNGKGSILEARELAGLFLLDEQLILHSAHEFKTCAEAFRRVLSLIQNTPELDRRVRRVRTSHGEEGIELKSGARLRFIARSTGSGRGFSGDCVILDEAYNLGDEAMSALLPTLSARPNPQLWYASSAGMVTSTQLARVRRRGVAGDDPGLAFFEWSIDPHTDRCREGCTAHDDPADPASWAKANPALGIRITADHVAREFRAMSPRAFAQERLGVGDYPLGGDGWAVISRDAWTSLTAGPVEQAELVPVAFAVDTTPERSHTSIGVAGRRDGLVHVELAEHRRGTGWVVPWLVERCEAWRPCAVVVDGAGPAGSLIADLEAAGVEVVKPSARDVAQACGAFYDAVIPQDGEPTLRHVGQRPLDAAVAGAVRRELGDAWAWSRRSASVDISPLVAVTLAAWGQVKFAGPGADYDVAESIY